MQGAKPFKEYADLVALLESRGMDVGSNQMEKDRAERKISQIGYYRLSGFSYPCREIARDSNGKVIKQHGKPKRLDTFVANTRFSDVIDLYLFDKRLRLLLLDAIERIEIYLKTVISHEVGREDPLAYLKSEFINPKHLKDYVHSNNIRNEWFEWVNLQRNELSRCKEDSIFSHKKAEKEIPIWVAVESWSFGRLSKYYEILKGKYQNKIAARVQVSNPQHLIRWLQELNTLRNRCAHHSRVWNQSSNNPLKFPDGITPDGQFFSKLQFTDDQCKRVFSLIAICWYLVQRIGPSSDWIQHVISLLDEFPNVPLNRSDAMGIPALALNSDGTINIDVFL